MKSELSLEVFVLKTTTMDGFSVIVGGICPEGMKDKAVLAYHEISKIKLGQFKDEYLIDYILANAITKLSPNWIFIAGASICIDGVGENTGGIIGNPFDDYESSQEEIEVIKEGLYMVSFPGGPGVAFAGKYSDGVMIRNLISDYKITENNKNIKDVINRLDEITNLYILIFDGCGLKSYGGIYISDYFGKKHETFA